MKRCSMCEEELNLNKFSYKNKKKGIRCSYCKECNKKYQKQHYTDNHEYHRQRLRKSNEEARRKRRIWLLNYYKTHPCVDCGETDPIVLQFDHVRGTKKGSLSHMILSAVRPMSVVEEEIKKCEVRCANCHARKTAERAEWYKGLL